MNMDTLTPKPCPSCGVEAKVCDHPTLPGLFYVSCSNEIDCNDWPITQNHSSKEEAIAAWNKEETI